MNKLFTKIAGLSLGLAMAIGVGVAIGTGRKDASPIFATDYNTPTNYNLATSVPSGLTASVSLSKDSNGRGMGKAGATYTLTTSASFTDVGKIVVNAATNYNTYSAHSVSATVGGNAFGSAQSFTSKASTNYTIEASKASGVVVVSLNNGKEGTTKTNTIWCLSIDVYTVAAPAQTYTVSFAVNTAGYGTVSQSSITNVSDGASITTNGNKVTINGTTVTATPSANTAQYTYAFSGWSNNTGTVTAARTITANFSRTTNEFTVSDDITNGSLDDTSSIEYGGDLAVQIVPDSGYSYPSEITVTMGGNDITGDVAYDDSDGTILYEGVTGNIIIEATCPSTGTAYEISTTVNNGTYTGATEIISGFTASITFEPNGHYKLPADDSAFTVSHAEIQSYNSSTGVLVLENPDDDVTVSVSMVAKAQNTISMGTLTGVSQAEGNPTSVEEGATVTLTFTANEGYGLPDSTGVNVTGTGSSYTWTQGTGKLQITGGTGNITVSIVGIARTITSISLSTNKGSYVLGDTFTMPTVTANYNVGASEEVTASATATGGGLVDGVLTETGSKTITISYGGFNASYTATVTAITPTTEKFVKVTSGTVASGKYLIVYETANVAFNGGINSTTYDTASNIVSVTISNGEIAYTAAMDAASFTYDASAGTLCSAAGYYIYRNGTSSGVTAQTSVPSLTTSITISGGNAIISNVKDSSTMRLRYNANSGQDRFRYYNNDSVQPIQIYKYQAGTVKELKWITAAVNAGTYYQGNSVTASDFVVTGHYNDGSTSTLSTGVTVTNGYLANIGNNEVTLTYSGKSCKVNVIAVEQTAEYTGLSWAQGEYTIIDGQNIDFSKFGTVTAEYNDGEAYATKAISSCTVAIYTKSGDVYTKVADLSDGATITSSSHGKYLGVTYTETNIFTAYSSDPIYVVESINPVQSKAKTWTFTDKATSIKVGDEVVIGAYYASGTTNYELAVENTDKDVFDGASYATNPAGTIHFEVVAGSSSGSFAFKNGSNYLACSKVKSLTYSTDLDAYSSWTVTFNGTEATISNAHDSTWILQFNYNQGSTRFAAYASEQVKPFLVLGSEGYTPVGEDIANTNALVQKAVLVFAKHFNDTMDCVNSGATTNVQNKWSTLSSDFTTAMSGFTGDDLDHFKALFAYADSVEGGDSLQDMLARYDYIIAKYKISNDFLHTGADRGAVSYSININPLQTSAKSAGTTIAIIAISAVSLAAIGGYFLFRKKKEN